MNQNHTITMNSQQRRSYMNSRGAISRNNMNNHRMPPRMSFGSNNHRGVNNSGGIGNQNKDLDCFNGNNSHSG